MGTSQKEDTFLTSLCEEMPGAPAPFTLGEPCPEASQCSETTAMGVTLRRQSQGVTVPKDEAKPAYGRRMDAPAGEEYLTARGFPSWKRKREARSTETPGGGDCKPMKTSNCQRSDRWSVTRPEN